jgi:hypothetical protein
MAQVLVVFSSEPNPPMRAHLASGLMIPWQNSGKVGRPASDDVAVPDRQQFHELGAGVSNAVSHGDEARCSPSRHDPCGDDQGPWQRRPRPRPDRGIVGQDPMSSGHGGDSREKTSREWE